MLHPFRLVSWDSYFLNTPPRSPIFIRISPYGMYVDQEWHQVGESKRAARLSDPIRSPDIYV